MSSVSTMVGAIRVWPVVPASSLVVDDSADQPPLICFQSLLLLSSQSRISLLKVSIAEQGHR